MKRTVFLTTVLALTAMADSPLFLDATPADNFKLHWLIKAETAPQIDGKLDDAVWQRAEPLTDWGTCNYGRTRAGMGEDFIPGEIDFRAAWDDVYLYLGARCYHRLHPNDMVEFRRQVNDLSKEIYARECLEIHIDGNLDHATRFQSIVNPLNEKMMIWHYDFGWGLLRNEDYGLDADWDVAARIEADHWTVEVRYALADIQITPGVGQMFGMNPCWFNWADSRAKDGKRYWWQFQTWSTHDDSHHDPRLFGRFILVNEKPDDLETGLRLAFPDLDQRQLLIQTADGYLAFDHGKSQVMPFDAQLRTELAAAQALLEKLQAQIAESASVPRHLTETLVPEQAAVLKDVAAAIAAGEPLSRGLVAGHRKAVAAAVEALDRGYWLARQSALLGSLQTP